MRKSNIELLRIIAALLVLISHADYISLGEPTFADINNDFVSTSLRIFWEQLSMIAVDIFVLISGWFGIKSSYKGFCKVLFPAILIPILIYTVNSIFNGFNLRGFGQAVFLGSSYWFIPAYLILYIFTPVLNQFIENSSQKTVLTFIISFFSLEFVYGWFAFDYARFYSGYSAISFIGLYSLARYIRTHCRQWTQMHTTRWFLLIFSIIIILSSIFVCLGLKSGLPVISDVVCRKAIAYNSPTIILGALFLLLSFSKMEFSSKIVNIVAPASFTVYLLNANPIILPLYCSWCKKLYANYPTVGYLLRLLACISAFFICAWLLNIICSLLWKPIEKVLFNKNDNVQAV